MRGCARTMPRVAPRCRSRRRRRVYPRRALPRLRLPPARAPVSVVARSAARALAPGAHPAGAQALGAVTWWRRVVSSSTRRSRCSSAPCPSARPRAAWLLASDALRFAAACSSACAARKRSRFASTCPGGGWGGVKRLTSPPPAPESLYKRPARDTRTRTAAAAPGTGRRALTSRTRLRTRSVASCASVLL